MSEKQTENEEIPLYETVENTAFQHARDKRSVHEKMSVVGTVFKGTCGEERQQDTERFAKFSYAPLITRKSDLEKLSGVANECFRKDVYALEVFDYATKRKTNEYEMKLV